MDQVHNLSAFFSRTQATVWLQLKLKVCAFQGSNLPQSTVKYNTSEVTSTTKADLFYNKGPRVYIALTSHALMKICFKTVRIVP